MSDAKNPETSQTSHSKSVTVTIFDDGNVTVEIERGISAFELWGMIGLLDMQARIMQASAMGRAQSAGGLVIPGRSM